MTFGVAVNSLGWSQRSQHASAPMFLNPHVQHRQTVAIGRSPRRDGLEYRKSDSLTLTEPKVPQALSPRVWLVWLFTVFRRGLWSYPHPNRHILLYALGA